MTIRVTRGGRDAGLRLLLAAWLALFSLTALASRPAATASSGIAAQPALTGSGVCQNLLGDSDFEAAVSPWSQTSIPDKVTLWGEEEIWPVYGFPLPVRACRPGSCEVIAGYNNPAGPQGGYFWAWFGGGITSTTPITQVTQIITQAFTVPVTATARLEFDLWISRVDPGATAGDRLEAQISSAIVFSATAAYTAPYSAGYAPVSVDLAGLGSGPINATLVLSATTRAAQVPAGSPQGPPIVNFNVDNVRVCAQALPATATPTATPTATRTPSPTAGSPPPSATTTATPPYRLFLPQTLKP